MLYDFESEPWNSIADPSVWANEELSTKQFVHLSILVTQRSSVGSPAIPMLLFEVLGYINCVFLTEQPSQS